MCVAACVGWEGVTTGISVDERKGIRESETEQECSTLLCFIYNSDTLLRPGSNRGERSGKWMNAGVCVL